MSERQPRREPKDHLPCPAGELIDVSHLARRIRIIDRVFVEVELAYAFLTDPHLAVHEGSGNWFRLMHLLHPFRTAIDYFRDATELDFEAYLASGPMVPVRARFEPFEDACRFVLSRHGEPSFFHWRR